MGGALSGLQLRVGGIGFGLASADPSLRVEARGAALRFLSPGGCPDVRMTAAWSGPDDVPPGEKVFDAGDLWSLFRQNGLYSFHFTAPRYGAKPYKTARFNSTFTSGELFLNRACFPEDEAVYPLEYPLDELLMVNVLARGLGVELHACGVRDADGAGYLFLGQSGAGKTTMANLWRELPGVHVLSDDRIILRRIDGQLVMYGTPWHGEAELACPLSAPVKRIAFLARGPENGAVALREAEAVGRLLACSFVPYFDREGLDFTLTFLQQAAQTARCAEYRIFPDARAVDFVRSIGAINA